MGALTDIGNNFRMRPPETTARELPPEFADHLLLRPYSRLGVSRRDGQTCQSPDPLRLLRAELEPSGAERGITGYIAQLKQREGSNRSALRRLFPILLVVITTGSGAGPAAAQLPARLPTASNAVRSRLSAPLVLSRAATPLDGLVLAVTAPDNEYPLPVACADQTLGSQPSRVAVLQQSPTPVAPAPDFAIGSARFLSHVELAIKGGRPVNVYPTLGLRAADGGYRVLELDAGTGPGCQPLPTISQGIHATTWREYVAEADANGRDIDFTGDPVTGSGCVSLTRNAAGTATSYLFELGSCTLVGSPDPPDPALTSVSIKLTHPAISAGARGSSLPPDTDIVATVSPDLVGRTLRLQQASVPRGSWKEVTLGLADASGRYVFPHEGKGSAPLRFRVCVNDTCSPTVLLKVAPLIVLWPPNTTRKVGVGEPLAVAVALVGPAPPRGYFEARSAGSSTWRSVGAAGRGSVTRVSYLGFSRLIAYNAKLRFRTAGTFFLRARFPTTDVSAKATTASIRISVTR